MIRRQKLADLASFKFYDLNIPSERAIKKLHNACFSFEIGQS